MEAIRQFKLKIRIAIINFKDECKAHGQNGVIGTAVSEEIIESLDTTQIENIIYHLKNHINKIRN